jgi:hypothetical protein
MLSGTTAVLAVSSSLDDTAVGISVVSLLGMCALVVVVVLQSRQLKQQQRMLEGRSGGKGKVPGSLFGRGPMEIVTPDGASDGSTGKTSPGGVGVGVGGLGGGGVAGGQFTASGAFAVANPLAVTGPEFKSNGDRTIAGFAAAKRRQGASPSVVRMTARLVGPRSASKQPTRLDDEDADVSVAID